jgi:ubiquinone/menaquinone biosynthesis C-methylase UbiE
MKSEKIYSFIGKIWWVYDCIEWFTGYKKSVRYFISQIPLQQTEKIKVLDVWCGTGVYSLAIAEKYKNAEITAFDINQKLVNFFQKRIEERWLEKRIWVFQGDVCGELNAIWGKKFDLIITSGVLVYVPHEKTIHNLSRFLKPQWYFFNSPNRDSIWWRFICRLYACKPYSKEENISAFEKNGFTLEKNIKVPKTPTASFKDAHIFRKK